MGAPLPGADQSSFEVASVKRAAQCGGRNSIDPGSVAFKGVPLKGVLRDAFKVNMEHIQGPSWLETDCFDISARIPAGASMDQFPAMLQRLLAERFKLAAHVEDRLSPGYALVVDKGGLKCKEDDTKTNFMGKDARPGLAFYGANSHGALKGVMTMARLASNLSHQVYGPVQEGTGLTGKYDIDLTWTADTAFASREPIASTTTAPGFDIPAPEGPSLFTALRASWD